MSWKKNCKRKIDSSNFARIAKTKREKMGLGTKEIEKRAFLHPGTVKAVEAGKCKGLTESELKRYAQIVSFEPQEFKRWYLLEYNLKPENKQNGNNKNNQSKTDTKRSKKNHNDFWGSYFLDKKDK